MTIIAQDIKWLEKIAENQQFRSTWTAKIKGEKYIVKKIDADKDKLNKFTKALSRQIRFSKILTPEEQKSICLFDSMVEADDFVAFIRPWCEGKTLKELLSEKKFTIVEAVDIILRIARVVALAHSHNVCHGDLKPANIIVADNGEITIIDWDTMYINESVDKFIVDNRTATIEYSAGTPHYMPIELFHGQKLDPRCDVYSLGVILYELLSGQTPFDDLQLNNITQLAIFKQNNEPESILVKFPELGIPQDLGRIIDEALKNDRNLRLQNLDTFIQRLETIGKITASQKHHSTRNSDEEEPIEEIKPGDLHKLVLIGHTGSGKTVLAAGLYATQDEDFAVYDSGSKTESGIHAINTKTILEEGHWPAATSVADITNLKFKVNYAGKIEKISFNEYAGERIAMENYERFIIGNPDGAIILINPGGKQWQDTRNKNKLLSDIKYYIDLLNRRKNRPPIALVVTASDRLKSDLKDFAPTFDQHVEELRNFLISCQCRHEVFRVSVSGVLENQNKPRLKPENIKEPFVWLLEQFKEKKRNTLIKRNCKIVSYVAIILAIFFFSNILHAAFSDNSRFKILSQKLALALEKPNEENRSVIKDIEDWQPKRKATNAKKNDLTKKCDEELKPAIIKYDFKHCNKNIDSLQKVIQSFKKFKQDHSEVNTSELNKQKYLAIETLITEMETGYKEKNVIEDIDFEEVFTKKILNELSDSDKKKEYFEKIKKTQSELVKGLYRKHQKEIDAFVEKNKHSYSLDFLDDFFRFHMEHTYNSKLIELLEYVVTKTKIELESSTNKVYKDDDYFKLQGLSKKIIKTFNGMNKEELKNFAIKSIPYVFAQKFNNWMEGDPENNITIDKIEASSQHKHGAYIRKCMYFIGTNGKGDLEKGTFYENNREVFFDGTKNIVYDFKYPCKPWQDLTIRFEPYEKKILSPGGIRDAQLSNVFVHFLPRETKDAIKFEGKFYSKGSSNYCSFTSENITYKVYFKITGKTIVDIYEECFR